MAPRPPRIFYAHGRWEPDEAVERDLARIRARACTKGFPEARVVSGLADFRHTIEHAKPSGDAWEFWARRWGAGRGPDGMPRYDWIVVPDHEGRARCGMSVVKGLRAALEAHKLVIFWHRGTDQWTKVIDIVMDEPIDAQAGWEIRCAPPPSTG